MITFYIQKIVENRINNKDDDNDELLHLAVRIFDRFIWKAKLAPRSFPAAAYTSLFIAEKLHVSLLLLFSTINLLSIKLLIVNLPPKFSLNIFKRRNNLITMLRSSKQNIYFTLVLL